MFTTYIALEYEQKTMKHLSISTIFLAEYTVFFAEQDSFFSNCFHSSDYIFVATEASWLVITIPPPDTPLSSLGQIANIGIFSALIVHIHAGEFICQFFTDNV
jgi:hypothetical protein